MSAPEIEALASPPTTIPWVPLWPLGGVSMGELAYAENPTNVAITATTEAGAQVVATAPAITCDGATPVVIDFFSQNVQAPASANASMSFYLFDGSTSLGLIGYVSANAAVGTWLPVRLARRLTPSAGAHTYSVRASVSTGQGNISGGAGGIGQNNPIFIRITLAAPISNAPAGALLPVQYGTSLPASPVDGQEAILVDSLTAPTYQWRFRYNAGSSSAYKWEFVGGAEAWFTVAGSDTIGSSGAWLDLPLGPLMVVPRAGEYIANGGADLSSSSASNLMLAIVSGAVNPGAMGWNYDFQQQASTFMHVHMTEKLAVAAGADIRLRYQLTAGTGGASRRWLRVRPVRVS